MLRRWWERWPGRLEFELEALKAAGIRVDSQQTDGYRLVFELIAQVNNLEVRLIARFPDLYPYTRFEVFAPDLELQRHQNPHLKNLCLVPLGDYWEIDATLADFISKQLPRVFTAATSEELDKVAELEIHQGEPVSHYYFYVPNAIIVVSSEWDLKNTVGGELTIEGYFDSTGLIRASVAELTSLSGEILARQQVVPSWEGRVLRGRWIRIQENIAHYTPDEFAGELFAAHPELKPIQGTKLPKGTQIDVIGVAFPEELTWRVWGVGWIFLVRIRRKDRSVGKFLVRAGRGGNSDLGKRIPELHALQTRRIALIGAGCLGAPSCIELARAGTKELRVLDGDFVEPGTIVRWPLGFPSVGRNKVEALSQFIKNHYPWCAIHPKLHRIGLAFADCPSDITTIKELLDKVDLVYDASAELDLQRMLSDVAKSLSIPYVGVSSTAGGWGGRVIRIGADNAACRACLDYHIADGAIPIPPASPHGMIEAPGCNAPTFTAANFDTSEVALMGVRAAVSTLCTEEDRDSYPICNWDVSILKLRDDHGDLVPPTWQGFKLDRHAACQNH